jgi:hypothetical protein
MALLKGRGEPTGQRGPNSAEFSVIEAHVSHQVGSYKLWDKHVGPYWQKDAENAAATQADN